MESYQMGRSCGRPYNHTCGMTKPQPVNREMQGRGCGCAMPENRGRDCSHTMPEGQKKSCGCAMPENDNRNCDCMMPGSKSKNAEMYSHLQHLEPAMAYVPCQKFTGIFELPYALSVGTVFPQLCEPFCGKRGGRR